MSISTWNIYLDNDLGTLSCNIINKIDTDVIFEFAKDELLHIYIKRIKKYKVRKNKVYVFDRTNISRWTDGYVWNDFTKSKLGRIYKQCRKERDTNGKVRNVKVYNGLTKLVVISKCRRYGLVNYY